MRWGLCCQFLDAPIKFRTATHRYCSALESGERQRYLSAIVLANAEALLSAIRQCASLGIGAFRVTSGLLPLATHPLSGYRVEGLPDAGSILDLFGHAKSEAKSRDVRLSFHPDQFVVLNSASPGVVTSSIGELEHQARVAELIGAEALTLHAGSTAGGVEVALGRLEAAISSLSSSARKLLALENDDRSFSPEDLLPFCERVGVPFVYDVHHHRCKSDSMTVREATERAEATWRGREPWMHISSPREGWEAANPRAHSDFIDPRDVPTEWKGRRVTIDVEAKQKERAVLKVMRDTGGDWPQ